MQAPRPSQYRSRFQVSRFPGFRFPGFRFPSFRFQVPGSRFQVPGFRFSGLVWYVSKCLLTYTAIKIHGSGFFSNEEIREALGTSDYIQWVLEDPCQPLDSSVRRAMLFVTYYRLPDRVPHVPEECYTGGGYRRLESEDVRFLIIESDRREEVPGRYLMFGASETVLTSVAPQFPVLYLFRVNGEYAGTRNQARLALNRNIFGSHAYFCKVELVFNQGFTAPTKADAMAAGQRMLRRVLPLLEAEHWPSFDAMSDSSPIGQRKRED